MAEQGALTELESICGALAAAGLSWEWEDRFSAALAVIQAPQHEQVLALLAERFAFAWDARSVREAPARVQELGRAWGLRPGQRLFTGDADREPLLFAAWWPWGGGDTFSLRVACTPADDAALAALRGCFGL